MKKQMEFEIGRLLADAVHDGVRRLQRLGDVVSWLGTGDGVTSDGLADIEAARLVALMASKKLAAATDRGLVGLRVDRPQEIAGPAAVASVPVSADEQRLMSELVDAGKGLCEIVADEDLRTIRKHVRPEVMVALCEVLEPARELFDIKKEELTDG